MKIAIPVDEQSLDSGVCPSFGRAPHIFFYNSINEETYYLDNTAVASRGGAGIRAVQVIADHGVKSLITPKSCAKRRCSSTAPYRAPRERTSRRICKTNSRC